MRDTSLPQLLTTQLPHHSTLLSSQHSTHTPHACIDNIYEIYFSYPTLVAPVVLTVCVALCRELSAGIYLLKQFHLRIPAVAADELLLEE